MTDADRLELLRVLRADAPRFGPTLATAAYERGLAVTDKDTGQTKPIPVAGTPVFIDEAELKRRQRLSMLLSEASVAMSRAVLGGLRRELVFGGLSPLEQTLAEATFRGLDTLVTTRVDFFAGQSVRALEVNATIPAMQGYSDIAANTFIETVARHWGVADHVIARWQARNGSNALALYRALLSGYAKVRPGQTPQRIALLCRRNDAQLTEQRYLCARFNEWGIAADVVHPDQLSGTGAVRADGKAYDLVYRHLFVRRLEEPSLQGADYIKGLLAEHNGTRAVVLNPPASQVEVKAVFALLSEAADDPSLAKTAGLSAEALEAIRATVPWTRVFRGAGLERQVAAHPERYVLKRSWDYGGRAVFVGRSHREASFTERVIAAYGSPLDWPSLCARAATDPVGGGFVVQELVELAPESHLICGPTGAAEMDLYVDFSAYASVGLEAQPSWGGVCRGSVSQIVNIVGGGGVLPLLLDDVGQSLLTAARARR